MSQTEIAARLKVARSVVSELLARRGPLPMEQTLTPGADGSGAEEGGADGPAAERPGVDGAGAEGPAAGGPGADGSGADGPAGDGPAGCLPAPVETTGAAAGGGLARITTGVYPSRYAGASLLYSYLDRDGTTGSSPRSPGHRPVTSMTWRS